jgi:nucleotide-binding universal stress UspA family protein
MESPKILIALDNNRSAKKVAELGFKIASSMNAEVVLLHVIIDPITYSTTREDPIMGYAGFMDIGPMQIVSNDELKKISQKFLDKTKLLLGDESIQTMVAVGDTSEFILKTAKKLHSNIIVMGSHSRRWLEDLIMGSTTEKVLRHTNIPIFIIPIKKNK